MMPANEDKPGYNPGRILGMFPRLAQVDQQGFIAGSTAVFFEGCQLMQATPAFRFATLSVPGLHSQQAVQWLLKRHCSLRPAQLGWFYVSLCVLSLGIAGFFWMQGATMVMPFAWLELVVVGIAFLVYARHASDGEKIVLQGGQLVVELENAGRTQRAEFNREWVRVEPRHGDGSLIEVSCQGRSVQVGRHVRPELRPALAKEIRFALRVC
jgi:uncharacterized membrane protein